MMMIHPIHSVVDWWMWTAFSFPVIILLIADMLLTGGNRWHRVTTKEAAIWSLFWIGLAIGFNFLLWLHLYHTDSIQIANEYAVYFFTGYLVEELISIESMLVFLMIIHFFKVPEKYHRKILLYGVIGAMGFRFLLLLLGLSMIAELYWMYYIFGCFLIFSGVKIIVFMKNDNRSISQNKWLNLIESKCRKTNEYHGSKLLVNVNHLWYVTPLFSVLIALQLSDIAFAMTSIPAIFGITQDPFIIYTSNVLAILGLRSLYFLMESLVQKFHFLKHSIALILIFIGGKMVISPWYLISIYATLGMIIFIIIFSIIASILFKPKVSIY